MNSNSVRQSAETGVVQAHKIGVLIPTYNRERMLMNAIDSVLAQTLLPQRLLVVDDGSSDHTAQRVAEKFESAAGRPGTLEYLRLPRGGVSRARNAGLRCLEDCEFVLMLDSDDELPADFLQRTQAALQADPEAMAASCRRFHSAAEGQRMAWVEEMVTDPLSWFFKFEAGVSSCTLFRRRFLQATGGFDESLFFGQDSDFYMRLVSRGGRWLFAPGKAVKFCDNNEHQLQRDAPPSTHQTGDIYMRWALLHEKLYGLFGQHLSPDVQIAVKYKIRLYWQKMATVLDECALRHYDRLPRTMIWLLAWRYRLRALLVALEILPKRVLRKLRRR